MTELIDTLERRQVRQIPDFRVGDRVRVHFQVVEGTRRRTQVFEGVVLKQKGGGSRRTFTVRKLSFGVGVERTFPVHSPKVERIEVVGRGEVRRAKLYYLRGRVGRKARLREIRDFRPEDVGMVGAPAAEATPAEDGAAAPEPEAEAAVEPPDEAVAESAEATEPQAEPAAEPESAEPQPPAEAEEPAAASAEETEPQPDQAAEAKAGDDSPSGEQQPA